MDEEELERYVRGLESLLKRILEAGRGDARCFKLTLEKVDMLHRSLT